LEGGSCDLFQDIILPFIWREHGQNLNRMPPEYRTRVLPLHQPAQYNQCCAVLKQSSANGTNNKGSRWKSCNSWSV